jgi:PAS domain S-box-containing protein
VIATDLESRVTGMNPSAEHLTGWALAQALGQRLTDVFRCVDTITREPVANRLHPVLSDGETLDMFDGATLLARNGREHRIADSVAPIRASSGEIIGMVLVFRDATAEYAAREKEARDADLRRQIGDVAKIGAWQLDVPSMDIVWSDELRGLYGLAPEAEVFFGRGLEYVVPEDRALAAAALRAGMEHGTPWDFDVRTIGADGVLRWLRSQGRAQMEDGKVVRLTGVVQDVSERNRAQRELEEQRLRMMAIVESAMDGVIAVDAQEHIVIFNSAAERMFGYSASEVLGRPLDRLISAHHRAAHHGHLREFGRTRKIASSMEARGVGAGRGTNAVRANGEEFPIEASISFSEVMGDAMYTVILRDISDRVAAARTLMDQRIELSELTRRMMDAEEATNRALAQSLHDQLGQTLTALRLSFDAFYGALPREAGGAAERWGGRMSDLIDRSVAQVRHVLVELRPALLEEMGLAAAIENEINNHAFVSGDLAIVFEPDAALLAHRWPDKVEYAAFMIAREAIANAVLHSAASCIRVRLTHGAVDLQLIVHDDGRGLTMDRRSHRVGHLGLVGMRERAIAIGGQLRVESAPGTGTTITLSWNAQ